MQALSALINMEEEEFMEKALDLNDSFLADTLHLMPFAPDDDDPDAPCLWDWIGDLFSMRYNAGFHIADLDKTISSYAQSLELTIDLDPEKVTRLVALGVALGLRYQRTGDLSDSDQACCCFESSLIIEPHACAAMMNLGEALLARFEWRGDLADVERALVVTQQVVDSAPDDDPERPDYLSALGNALQLRFERLGNISDLEAAIDTQRKAVELIPEGHPDRPSRLSNLGNSLQSRFEHLGNISDLEVSLDTKRMAVELTLEGHPTKPGLLNNLGNSLQLRFERLSNVSDLEASINTQRKAVELTPEGHPDEPCLLDNLGNALHLRFEHLGNVSDLEESINAKRKAVELTPEGHPDKPSRLSNLGTSLRLRFERLGNISDLKESIDTQRKAVELIPVGHPYTPGLLNNLGSSLQLRFKHLGIVSDLEASIDTKRKAVELTPERHLNIPSQLVNLGNSLQSRFERLGNVSDLEASIDAQRKAVELTPVGHPGKPSWLNNLGKSLQLRFERLGNVSDLEASIDIQRKAVELTPEGHPDKPSWLNNLGTALQLRFERLGDVSDLEASIDTMRKAVELTPEGHPDKPIQLGNLGNSLRMRFERLGNVSDLETSIDTQRKAVELTPEGHPDKPGWLSNLGNSLQSRFERLGNVSDLEASINIKWKAVELTPEKHANKSLMLNQLFTGFVPKILLGDYSHLQEGMEALSTSSQSVFGNPSVKLGAAQIWGDLSEQISDNQQTMRAYSCAVSLIPQVAWMGLAMQGRHEALASIGDLVIRAAAAAVRCGQPDVALEWLEQGRSVVWGQTLQLRSPVDILHDHDPIRAEGFIAISRALDANPKDATSPDEEKGRQLRALSLEWDRLLAEVRATEGFEDFLGPKKFEHLLLAASIAPIVVLNIHKAGCDALVLRAQAVEVIHIPLQFTSERAQVLVDSLQKARSGRSVARHADPVDRHIQVKGVVKLDPEERMKTLLAELWNSVVKPVLVGLAFSLPDSIEDDLPRICWCLTGPLTFLPIHAAGLYDTEERGTKVFEFVVSSYTPTVTALLRSPTENLITPKILAVAQSEYPGRQVSALPETKQESARIVSLAAANSIDIIVAQDAAGTVKRVVEQMTECSWIHLACHGIQDVQSPTKSAFILADGNLELEEIVKLNLPHAEFAFLSACQTATGDEKLAEEAVHLAAGMMLAGYRGVIATMWSIRDQDGPIVADVVYSELLKDGKADASRAAHALHKAVGQLRSSGASFLSWIPFIHMGR